MASVFTRIINGDLPGAFVWRDDRCVAIMSINPLAVGHTLVIPIEEVDHWTDCSPELAAHLFSAAHRIAIALRSVFACERVGMIVAGFEVAHTHLHLIPARSMAQLSFENAAASVGRDTLDDAAKRIREQLDVNRRPH